jgi:predicted metal-dependent HD superfamily phosphohydrolase
MYPASRARTGDVGHDEAVEELLRPWAVAVGAGPASLQVGQSVLERYAEPHRTYHDARHLAEVLAALRVLVGAADVPVPVVCAAYWHDAVYDPRAGDNEHRSAELAASALARLSLAPQVVDEVVRLVLLTASHDPAPDDRNGALLSDADLAVLGADRTRYDEYAAAVRREYGHVGEGAFRTGRSAVLRDLLGRPRLYATQEGRRRWETAARDNLRGELTRLAAGAGAAPPP